MNEDLAESNLFRVLSLDGGGAKGFYTLGALKEIEALVGCHLCKKFDLIYGTSTGAIIAAPTCASEMQEASIGVIILTTQYLTLWNIVTRWFYPRDGKR